MEDIWLKLISDAVVVGMLGYNLSIFKDLAKKIVEDNKLAHDRISLHDRMVSEDKSRPFDTAAIVKGYQSYPIFKPRRDS